MGKESPPLSPLDPSLPRLACAALTAGGVVAFLGRAGQGRAGLARGPPAPSPRAETRATGCGRGKAPQPGGRLAPLRTASPASGALGAGVCVCAFSSRLGSSLAVAGLAFLALGAGSGPRGWTVLLGARELPRRGFSFALTPGRQVGARPVPLSFASNHLRVAGEDGGALRGSGAGGGGRGEALLLPSCLSALSPFLTEGSRLRSHSQTDGKAAAAATAAATATMSHSFRYFRLAASARLFFDSLSLALLPSFLSATSVRSCEDFLQAPTTRHNPGITL